VVVVMAQTQISLQLLKLVHQIQVAAVAVLRAILDLTGLAQRAAQA
jgi:hypothetical protein